MIFLQILHSILSTITNILSNYLPSEAGVVNEPQLIRCGLGEVTRSGKGGSLREEFAQAAEHLLALLAPAGEQALQGRVVVSP